MKILYCFPEATNPNHYAYSNIRSSLLERGCTIVDFDFLAALKSYGQDATVSRLRALIDSERPDIFLHGIVTDELPVGFLDELRDRNDILSIVFFSDDDWRIHNHSLQWVKHYNFATTNDINALDIYRRAGCNHVFHMQYAANPRIYYPREVSQRYDVTFVGQVYLGRPQLIYELMSRGVKVRVWGAGWEKIPELKSISGPPLSTEQMIETFCASKIVLGLAWCSVPSANGQLMPQIKGRTFEYPACRAFQITYQDDRLKHYFDVEKEIAVFRNGKDLADKIAYYLSHDREREQIAEAAYRRVISEHTWRRRWDDFFRFLAGHGLSAENKGAAAQAIGMISTEPKTTGAASERIAHVRSTADGPLVSVYCFVYNREKYIAQTIESVLNQTHRNIELVILNDGSTDNTENIIKQYLHDPRIKYHYQENIGRTLDRFDELNNRAVQFTSGDYICPIGVDDVFLPHKTERQLREFKQYPELEVSFCNAQIIDEQGNALPSHFRHPRALRFNRFNLLRWLFTANFIPHPSVMIKRKAFYDQGCYETGFATDFHFWLKTARHLNFKHLDENLWYYRVHGEATTSGKNAETCAQATYDVLREIYEKNTIDDFYPELNACSDRRKALYGAHLDFGNDMLMGGFCKLPPFALKEYKAALASMPDGIEALNNIAVASIISGKREDAMRYFDQLRPYAAGNVTVSGNLAIFAKSAAEEVKPDKYQILLEGNSELKQNIELLSRSPEIIAGSTLMRPAGRTKPDNSVSNMPQTDPGVAKWRAGEKEAAFELFERGLMMSPSDADALSLYQTAVMELGRFARAEEVFAAIIADNPLYVKVRFAYISALLSQEKNVAAMREIEKTLLAFGIDDGIIGAALEVREKVGPMEIQKAATDKGTLSVCMIVKDEEENIARCLMSLKPVADEIIVVDTGSTDRTKDLARAFGAKIHEFTWTEDFSEARNYSLSKASGEWILVIDADEVISPLDYAALGALIKKTAKPVAYSIWTRNYVDFTGMHNWEKNDGKYPEEAGKGWIKSPKVRLFPNDSRIRFENPVHELVEGAVKKAGLEIRPAPVIVHHYGKMDKEKSRKKDALYLELGRAKLQSMGENDPKALWELAMQEFVSGNHVTALERFNDILRLDHEHLRAVPRLANVYMQVGICYLCLQRFSEAAPPLRKALELDPVLKEAHVNFALASVYLGNAIEAVAILEKLSGLDPDFPNCRPLLAASYLCAGKKTQGLGLIKSFAADRTSFEEFLATMTKELLELGQREYAMAVLETLDENSLITPRLKPLLKKGRMAARKGTLSVCMIVRNEEEHIARCLASLKPVSDEIIVVDTGSTDRTRDLARASGAKVYDFPWTNDFSEARNYSLSKATGQWILVMDADEVISPLDYAALGALIKAGVKPVAYSFLTRNYVEFTGILNWERNDGRYPEEVGSGWLKSFKVRLFPNNGGIRFENPVHEFVEGTLKSAGMKIKTCAVTVHHFGIMNADIKKKKGELYLELGKTKLKNLGNDNPKALWEIAAQEFALHNYANALEYFTKILSLDHSLLKTDPRLANVYMQVGICNVCLNKYDDAVPPLKKALELDPNLREAKVGLAHAAIFLGNAPDAVDALEELFKRDPDFPFLRCYLAVAYLCSGKRKEGLALIKTFIRDRASFENLLPVLAKELLSFGRREYTMAILETLDENSLITPHLRPVLEEGRKTAGRIERGKNPACLRALEAARELHRRDQVDKAVERLIEGIKSWPGEAAIYHAMAEILIDAKRFKDALEAVNSLPDCAKDEPLSLALAGYGAEGMGLVDEAETYADRALSLEPGFTRALNLKGMIALKRGDRTSAEAFFEKAIEADPACGEPYTNIGVLKWHAGEKEKALDLFERGVTLSPAVSDSLALYQTAVTEMGRFARAETVLREAAAAYPLHKKLCFSYISALLSQEKNAEAMREIEQAMLRFGVDDNILAAALNVREKVGPMELGKSTSTKGTLSVCMIVKNEEVHLARCLMSLKPVSGELIVVDTGSTDRTKDLARAFGAKVYDFQWTNDFSEARNFSLSKAKGRWILAHDGDEVISELDYDNLRKLLMQKQPKPVAYTLVTRNYITNPSTEGWTANSGAYPAEESGTGWFPSPKVRLFPNDPRIRFQNPVHEIVEPSLARAGFAVRLAGIPVHHYGKLNQEKSAAKSEMYYLMGKRKLGETDNDPAALRELAIQAAELRKYDEALELFQRYSRLKPDDHVPYFNMTTYYLELGKFNDALRAAIEAVRLAPNSQEALLGFAAASLCTGDIQTAISTLEDLLRRVPAYPPATAALAACYSIMEERGKAHEIYEEMRKRGYNASIALQSLAMKLVAGGWVEHAIRVLRGMIESGHVHEETKKLLEECEARRDSES